MPVKLRRGYPEYARVILAGMDDGKTIGGDRKCDDVPIGRLGLSEITTPN